MIKLRTTDFHQDFQTQSALYPTMQREQWITVIFFFCKHHGEHFRVPLFPEIIKMWAGVTLLNFSRMVILSASTIPEISRFFNHMIYFRRNRHMLNNFGHEIVNLAWVLFFMTPITLDA